MLSVSFRTPSVKLYLTDLRIGNNPFQSKEPLTSEKSEVYETQFFK